MTVKAYVMITCDSTLTRDVADKLRSVPQTKEVNEVLGPYDIVVELETEHFEDVTDVLRKHIRSIPGVRNTLTCVAMR